VLDLALSFAMTPPKGRKSFTIVWSMRTWGGVR
jgi:hypothetical protein